jgi:hypothetical protein
MWNNGTDFSVRPIAREFFWILILTYLSRTKSQVLQLAPDL